MKLTKPGDIYIDNNGQPHVLESFYTEPSATMRSPATGAPTEGGIYSLNLQPFVPMSECDRSNVEEALRSAVRDLSRLRLERDELQFRLIDAQNKILELQCKELLRIQGTGATASAGEKA